VNLAMPRLNIAAGPKTYDEEQAEKAAGPEWAGPAAAESSPPNPPPAAPGEVDPAAAPGDTAEPAPLAGGRKRKAKAK
jgi:hypothetical protein